MIAIKENVFIKDTMFSRHTKKTIECPLCQKDVSFFDVSPIMCYYCDMSFPSANKIFREAGYRLDYHFGALKL